MTKQKKILWYKFLRNYPVRFLRQKVIENYIVDFYCAKANLVIELDGGQHYEDKNIKLDKQREDVISKYGIKIMRFTNIDIDNNLEGCCKTIDDYVKSKFPFNSPFDKGDWVGSINKALPC